MCIRDRFCVDPRHVRVEPHGTLGGHVPVSYTHLYDEARFFSADGAPADVVALRRQGFANLAELFRTRFARSAALAGEAAEGISDLQFTASYRVPFQFSRYVRERLKGGGFLQASAGVKVTDLDGYESVSYTHLDVYKRQMLTYSPGGRFRSSIWPSFWLGSLSAYPWGAGWCTKAAVISTAFPNPSPA